jgi:hypothetical protein
MIPAAIFSGLVTRSWRSSAESPEWSGDPRGWRQTWGDDPMVVINDLVEDWIQIRSTLQRQLKMLQSESDISESARNATIARIKSAIEEMNALLKEYARVHQA